MPLPLFCFAESLISHALWKNGCSIPTQDQFPSICERESSIVSKPRSPTQWWSKLQVWVSFPCLQILKPKNCHEAQDCITGKKISLIFKVAWVLRCYSRYFENSRLWRGRMGFVYNLGANILSNLITVMSLELHGLSQKPVRDVCAQLIPIRIRHPLGNTWGVLWFHVYKLPKLLRIHLYAAHCIGDSHAMATPAMCVSHMFKTLTKFPVSAVEKVHSCHRQKTNIF